MKRNAIIAFQNVVTSSCTAIEAIEALIDLGVDATEILRTINMSCQQRDESILFQNGSKF